MKPSKKCYAAIDLHSNNLFIAVVDSKGRRLAHARLFCELHEVDKFLRRRKARIEAIAVESTFNWYWLVDGLRALGYNVVLANPAGIMQYDGLKHADDRSDAFFLAELLRLGILPTGYVLEPKLRAVRDLLRRRASLVSKRTSPDPESAQHADAHPGWLPKLERDQGDACQRVGSSSQIPPRSLSPTCRRAISTRWAEAFGASRDA